MVTQKMFIHYVTCPRDIFLFSENGCTSVEERLYGFGSRAQVPCVGGHV